MQKFKPLVFSGMQPTGNLQLGNYLGAIKQWVELQNDYDCIYCIVDMHALTTNSNPEKLAQHTREVAATFLAAGIDAEKHIIFNQSRVFQHAELAWIFNCVARISWMNRMTQFKDKAGKNRNQASLGLLAYPNLMSADILVYRATHVPVGEDQKQHLELTRDIAQKFNHDYSERISSLNAKIKVDGCDKTHSDFFPIVKSIIRESSMRIMSLRDGRKKMSKSDPADMSRINIIDTANDISRKIRKAKTDYEPLPETEQGLENRPEASNLVGIYAALANTDKGTVLAEFGGKQFSDFKPALIELVVKKLLPISSELRRIRKDSNYIDRVLREGAERASSIAEETMKHVRDIIGFLSQ